MLVYFKDNPYKNQIDSCTIDGNVEFSVQLFSYVTSVNLVFVSDKINNNSDNFRIKCLPYSKMCSLFSVFTIFYLILENMSANVTTFCFPCCYILHL